MKQVVRKLKVLVRALAGKELLIRPNTHPTTKKFGNEYGGWDVATENLSADSIVYSFGVGEDASFDLALIEIFGLTVHAFDPTPKSIEWVQGQPLPPQFVMHPYGVGGEDETVSFNPPQNPNDVSHTILDRQSTHHLAIAVPIKRLRTIMSELGHEHIDILKMDIEGAEYAVIDDMQRSQIYPQQILVEFHHRFDNVEVGETKRAIALLKAMGYALFSVSATNKEFCFIRQTN